jgi:hypothetical protein
MARAFRYNNNTETRSAAQRPTTRDGHRRSPPSGASSAAGTASPSSASHCPSCPPPCATTTSRPRVTRPHPSSMPATERATGREELTTGKQETGTLTASSPVSPGHGYAEWGPPLVSPQGNSRQRQSFQQNSQREESGKPHHSRFGRNEETTRRSTFLENLSQCQTQRKRGNRYGNNKIMPVQIGAEITKCGSAQHQQKSGEPTFFAGLSDFFSFSGNAASERTRSTWHSDDRNRDVPLVPATARSISSLGDVCRGSERTTELTRQSGLQLTTAEIRSGRVASNFGKIRQRKSDPQQVWTGLDKSEQDPTREDRKDSEIRSAGVQQEWIGRSGNPAC